MIEGSREFLKIGEVARRASVGIETVRFYERSGLLPEPPRSANGYRKFPREAVSRLHFISRAKDVGFSLDEISELLSLREDPDGDCSDVKKRAERKIEGIRAKIADLERMKVALERLVASCGGRGPTNQCTILEFLANGPQGDVGD